LAINRRGRCRLCTTARRAAHLAGDPDWAVEPGQRAGIQLFLGDRFALLAWRPDRPRAEHADPCTDPSPITIEVDGQLELFDARPEPHRADVAAHAWAASPAGTELIAAVDAFARTRGWPTGTTHAVQQAVALLAVTSPAFEIGPVVEADLRHRYIPLGRLREFLTAAELIPTPTDTEPAERVARGHLADLPAPMVKEMTAWVESLSGAVGRGRARSSTTIDSYRRAITPAVREWAMRYPSLRQVVDDDIIAFLEPLRGSHRTHTAVALRSLFGTLKARRMIFADPTRRIRPGKFPRRPVLGLDETARAELLTGLDRADHRLVVMLAAVHALSRADITALRLDHIDTAARTIVVRGKARPLDTLTYQKLVAWLRERHQRWPTTANPHLLITKHSALGVRPASSGYFRALPIAVSQLRADRLLAQARDTGGDALTLMHLFGLSDDAAVRYCIELDLREPNPR
jgi:integrase